MAFFFTATGYISPGTTTGHSHGREPTPASASDHASDHSTIRNGIEPRTNKTPFGRSSPNQMNRTDITTRLMTSDYDQIEKESNAEMIQTTYNLDQPDVYKATFVSRQWKSTFDIAVRIERAASIISAGRMGQGLYQGSEGQCHRGIHQL